MARELWRFQICMELREATCLQQQQATLAYINQSIKIMGRATVRRGVTRILSKTVLSSLLIVAAACGNSGRSVPIASDPDRSPLLSPTAAQTTVQRTAQKPPTSPSAAQPSPIPTQAPADRTNLMGMNVDFPGDYSRTRMFADAIKQSRLWQKAGSEQPATLNAKGWPTEDADITVWHGIGRMHGTYRLSFKGQAEVKINCCAGRLENLTYSAATNTTTADLVYPSQGEEGLFLGFRNTRLSASAPFNSGITDVKLMRPITEGGTQTYPPTTLFTPPFKEALRRFKVLRFMDFLASNGNIQKRWSERLTPDWYSMHQSAPGYGWQGRGGAYEYAIALCNELKTDCWLTVPVQADDDYVRQLATLIKSQLSPELKVYMEYSNELWNTAPAFSQSKQNYALAKAEVAQGKSPLNFDGETNDWFWAWRRVAKRSAEISLIFRQTFGDAAMMQRIRPVLMTQLGYADGPLYQAIHFMEGYYNNPARVSNPKPANYYLYGVGGSGYYGPKNLSSPNAAFADLTDQVKWTADLQQDANYAAAFGLKRIAYEAGPDLEGDNVNDTNRSAYRDDPRMKSGMVSAHDVWSRQGGDLKMYFTITGESPWGFVADIWDAQNSRKNLKLQAIDVLNTRPRVPVTYGVALPATLDTNQYNIPPRYVGWRPDQVKPGNWFGYTAHTTRPGIYNLKLQAIATEERSQVEVWVSGLRLGVVDVPKQGLLGGSTETKPLSVRLDAGLQGILLRGKSGTVNVSKIVVTQ